MDVEMKITIGGGKKANRESRSIVLKEASTWDETVTFFAEKFAPLFPKYGSLEEPEKKQKRGKDGK